MSSNRVPPVLAHLDTSNVRNYGSGPSVGETPLGLGFQAQRTFPLFICITEYNKRMDDELDMKPGDKIQVITDDGSYNDGWYFGRNLRTQEEGLYPKVFTQVIAMERKPTLMRAKSSKRVASPMVSGSNVNLSYQSNDDSSTDLPTPQPIESAELVDYKQLENVPVDRNISMKSTMSDIDKALEELRGDSLPSNNELNVKGNRPSNGRVGSGSSLDFTANNSLSAHQNDHLRPENVRKWTPEQVTAYLISIGYDVESASRFQKHKISGPILLELELAHLKELEINSFGTRFEIFKEIEALKTIASQNDTTNNPDFGSSLMPAASFEKKFETAHEMPSYRGHIRQTSQSLEELPSNSTPNPPDFVTPSTGSHTKSAQKVRPASLLFTNETTKAPEISEEIFTSPRRAPKPPSYPSPVQPSKSPMVGNAGATSGGRFLSPPPSTQPSSSDSNSSSHPTIYQQVKDANAKSNHVKNGTDIKAQGFQFPPQIRQGPSSSVNSPSLPNPYNKHSQEREVSRSPTQNPSNNRNSVVYTSHTKSKSGSSFVDLFNRISLLSENSDAKTIEQEVESASNIERPSSSIYAHSRAASHAPSHGRKSSQVSNPEKKHRRNSSLLSFFKEKDEHHDINPTHEQKTRRESRSHSRKSSFVSPFKAIDNGTPSQRQSMILSTSPIKDLPTSRTKKDGKKRSFSAKEANSEIFYDATDKLNDNDINKNRSVSESTKPRAARSTSTKNVGKQKTTAFTEGIRSISVTEAMRNADCFGWMSKKGTGAMGVWKNRFFTLHGTRLSYFASTTETRERGLIDITAHRVLPAKEDDKFVSLYAASTGKGRFCFKLVPPQPGSKKGLTFTQPRVHYFAVETKDEMRAWIAALIKATIDIDTSVPIISSCATPTVSLSKAQEMLSQAREETKLREQQRSLNEQDEDLWDQHRTDRTQSSDDFANLSSPSMTHNTTVTSGLTSPYLMADQLTSNSTATTGNTTAGLKTPLNHGQEYFGLDPKFVGNRI